MTSIMSKIAWVYLKTNGYQKKVRNPVTREVYFSQLKKINEGSVEPPVKRIKSEIEKENINGVDTFVLGTGKGRAILYLHGGSYCEQPVLQHWQCVDMLARKGEATVYFPIYEMAPNTTFESAYEYLPVIWDRLIAAYGAERITLMGDSAGGGLALAFAEYLVKHGLPQPCQIILFSPWLDLSMETEVPAGLAKIDPMLVKEWLVDAGSRWAGMTDIHDYRVSPMAGDFHGLAPMTVYFGTYELFLPDARKFRDRCLKEGIDLTYVEGNKMCHTYPLFPTPEGRKVRNQVVRQIRNT